MEGYISIYVNEYNLNNYLENKDGKGYTDKMGSTWNILITIPLYKVKSVKMEKHCTYSEVNWKSDGDKL